MIVTEEFQDDMKIPPKDLISKFKKKRQRLICGQWVPGWKMAWCYFNLNMNYLQMVRSKIEACDVEMIVTAEAQTIFTNSCPPLYNPNYTPFLNVICLIHPVSFNPRLYTENPPCFL